MRYSDPVSSEALRAEEDRIKLLLSEISGLLGSSDIVALKKKEKELLVAIEQRNSKCRKLKSGKI